MNKNMPPFIKEFYIILLISRMKMAATSYDGMCKNCGANLSVWIEVRKNIEGVPVPEVWCIDCVRSGGNNNNNLNHK
jgi:hypothetical protein